MKEAIFDLREWKTFLKVEMSYSGIMLYQFLLGNLGERTIILNLGKMFLLGVDYGLIPLSTIYQIYRGGQF